MDGAADVVREHLLATLSALGSESFEYLVSAVTSILSDASFDEHELREFLLPYLEESGLGEGPLTELVRARSAAGGEEEKVVEDPGRLCHAQNLTLLYGGSKKYLLKDATLSLRRGRCYGLVGTNGSGKTSLMSAVAQGQLVFGKTLKCCYIQYEGILDNLDPSMSCEAYFRQRALDVGSVRGLQQLPLDAAVGHLSGGWRMRLALAAGLASGADLYLLDEPTNHLDAAGKEWLQGCLKDCSKTAMVISHDFNFLQEVCTDIIHLTAEAKLEYHTSPETSLWTSLSEDSGRAQLEAREEMASASRFGTASGELTFPVPSHQGLPHVVASLTDCSFRHQDQLGLALTDISLQLTRRCRVGLVGVNGAGKSTLLNLLAQELLPLCEGDGSSEVSSVWHHPDLRMAYISQQHFYHLSEHLEKTAVDYIQERFGPGWDEELRLRLVPDASACKALAAKYGGKPYIYDTASRTWRGREVAQIVDRRIEDGKLQYQVRWKLEENEQQSCALVLDTWETARRLRTLGVELLCVAFESQRAYARMPPRSFCEVEVRKHLRSVGITQAMSQRPIRTFSAGQMSKLVLAAALWNRPHIILLDEPTNFLDHGTLQALEGALTSFKGGYIVASHNEDFLHKVCTTRWSLEGGHLTILDKDGFNKSDLIKSKLLADKARKEEQLAREDRAPRTLEAKPEDVGHVTSREIVHAMFRRFLDFYLPEDTIDYVVSYFVQLAEEHQPARGEDWLKTVLSALVSAELELGCHGQGRVEFDFAAMSPILVALVKVLLQRGAVGGVDDGLHLPVTSAYDVNRARAAYYGACCYCGRDLPAEHVDYHTKTCFMSPMRCGRVLKRIDHEDPDKEPEYIFEMFHGTSAENAASIERSGFRPSVGGMLGPGVYCSRDLRKARRYGPVVLRLAVSLGRVLTIDRHDHPLRTTWQTLIGGSFDAAWVPPHSGVVPSGLEENCVRSPRQITLLGRVRLDGEPTSVF